MIYYDYTSTFRFGRTTGIQRVVSQLGASLLSQLPRDFTTVTFSSGRFYPCALGVQEQRTVHQFRRWLRKRTEVPFERLRNLVNTSAHLSQIKASLWDALEEPPMIGEPVQFNKGDWYFTADALWEIPSALSKIAALRQAGVLTAVVHYDLAPLLHPDWCASASSRMFLRYAQSLSQFDVVFCISEQVKSEFSKFCRQQGLHPPDAIVTIQLGHEFHQAAAKLGAAPAAIPNKPFALCVGTLDQRKNQHALLDAFDALCAKGIDLRLVIVGAIGYQGEQIRRRILNHPLHDNKLILLSGCPDIELERLYQECSFTVCASLFEGYGLPVVESLARGKPCLCSDLAVFHETAGDFGLYFDPKDAQSIAQRIADVCSNADKLAFLSRKIRANYRPPTWSQCARVVLNTLGYEALGET
jgi:glycosyltransferase involved in cell wall biosynthesis